MSLCLKLNSDEIGPLNVLIRPDIVINTAIESETRVRLSGPMYAASSNLLRGPGQAISEIRAADMVTSIDH